MKTRSFIVTPEPPLTPDAGIRLVLELAAATEFMKRQNLREDFPSESDDEIIERLRAWRQTRPGAEDGDGAGRRVPWPRTR